jgi:hypothetical protein
VRGCRQKTEAASPVETVLCGQMTCRLAVCTKGLWSPNHFVGAARNSRRLLALPGRRAPLAICRTPMHLGVDAICEMRWPFEQSAVVHPHTSTPMLQPELNSYGHRAYCLAYRRRPRNLDCSRSGRRLRFSRRRNRMCFQGKQFPSIPVPGAHKLLSPTRAS